MDNLEHGLAVDTEFFSRKKAGECPERSEWLPELARIDIKSEPVQGMIRELVNRRVAITSTLAVFEEFVDEKFELDPRMQDVPSEDALADYRKRLAAGKKDLRWSRACEAVLKKEMDPAANIRDIRNVQLVFKDGVGYDPAKLIESVRGLVVRSKFCLRSLRVFRIISKRSACRQILLRVTPVSSFVATSKLIGTL